MGHFRNRVIVAEPSSKPKSDLKECDESSIRLRAPEELLNQGAEPSKVAEAQAVMVKEFEATDAQGNTKSSSADSPSVTDHSQTPENKDSLNVWNSPPRYYGIIRHRIIVAACVVASLSFIGFSAFDPASLISREATINSSFQATFLPKMPDLPVGLMYSNYDDSALPPDQTRFKICQDSWGDQLVGFSDRNGKVVVKPQFEDAHPFADGLAAVCIGKKDKAKWGYIDEQGQMVIAPKFDNACDFENGVAMAGRSGKFNLIDKKGETVMPLTRSIQTGSDPLIVQGRRKVGLMDRHGKWIVEPKFDGISPLEAGEFMPFSGNRDEPDSLAKRETYFTFVSKGSTGLMDASGKVVVPANFDNIWSYNKGHAAVVVDGKCGFVDASGKMVIEPRYDFATAYDDIIAVRTDRKWSFINSEGKVLPIKPPDAIICANSGYWLSDGLGPVIYKDGCGYVNTKGEIVINPTFDMASRFRNGYAAVQKGYTWKYIDRTGKYVSPLEFTEPAPILWDKPTTVAGPLFELVQLGQGTNQYERSKAVRERFKEGSLPANHY